MKSVKSKRSKSGPKSAAQKMAEYRERLKAKLGVEAYNEMERKRRRKSYIRTADLTPEQLEERRRKGRETARRFKEARQKK